MAGPVTVYQDFTFISHPDVLLALTKFLDKGSLTKLEQTCKNLFELLVKDIIWSGYLEERQTIIISNARIQVLHHAKSYCSFLFSKIAKENQEMVGKNVFDAIAIAGTTITQEINNNYSTMLIDLHYAHRELTSLTSDNLLHAQTKQVALYEADLKHYIEFGCDPESARDYICRKTISKNTVAFLIKKMGNFIYQEIDFAICNKFSDDLILFMLLRAAPSALNQNLLRRALQQKEDQKIILFLLDRVEFDSENLEIALWNGYPESIISKMYNKVCDTPFTDSSRIMSGAFYGDSSQKGKEMGETHPIYSEELVCKMLDKLKTIEGRYLEASLDRNFLESNLKKFVQKVNQITSREFAVAARKNISDELLKMMISKSADLSSYEIGVVCFSEEILQMLLNKNATFHVMALDEAIEKKYSEDLIKSLISLVDQVNTNTITEAKKQNYSREVIKLLEAKCPNSTMECIIC